MSSISQQIRKTKPYPGFVNESKLKRILAVWACKSIFLIIGKEASRNPNLSYKQHNMRFFKAFDHEKAKSIIVEENGAHFDPRVVEAFLASETKFLELKEKLQDK